MDDLLTMYSQETLLSELEQGHYWYYDGKFHSNADRSGVRPTSVENAVYYRFYS